MNRFVTLFLGCLLSGLLVTPSTVLAEPPVSCQATYAVQSDDTLAKIADKWLGNPLAYPLIMVATNRQAAVDYSFTPISRPDILEVGWQVCIPSFEEPSDLATMAASLDLTFASPSLVSHQARVVAPDTPYKLDDFVADFQFGPAVSPSWIYQAPPPVSRYDVLPEHQSRHDAYGYRSNYWWSEHLSDFYFTRSGIFDAIPPDVWLYNASWGSSMPRYRYPPNVTLPTGLTTNGFGWRGQPLLFDKPERTIRIAAIGASTTVSGHAYPYSYPEILQYWLNLWAAENRYPFTFEVINTGREGIGSSDMATVVRYEILPMDVDYIIYYEGSNQFNPRTVVSYPADVTYGKPPPGLVPNEAGLDSDDQGLLDRLSEYSALAVRARNIVEQFLITGEEPPKPAQTFYLPEGVDEFNPQREKLGGALALGKIVRDLDQIKQDLDSQEIKMFMSSFSWFAYDDMVLDPSRHRYLYIYLNRKYWPISYENMRRAADFQNRVFAKWAINNNVPLIDVSGQMPRQPDIYNDAIHNNPLGMKIRAWLIFEGMLPYLKQDIESGLMPRPDRVSLTKHPYIQPHYQTKPLLDPASGDAVSAN